MSTTDKNNTGVAIRPSSGESYRFSSDENKDSLVKTYFQQVDTKGLKDPFVKYYRMSEFGVEIIKPPINPYALVKIIQENSFLSQCIDAMVTNIHGFGYRLEFIGKEVDQTSDAAKTELQWLEELFDHPNTYMSFQELRERLAWDYWVFGNSYLEITRDNKGKVMTMHHVPASTMRITKVDPKSTPVKEILMRYGKPLSVVSNKNFRRFVQLDDLSNRVWFKEFGDPRLIDPKTGQENTALTLDTSATEIIQFGRYNGQSVYGLPMWYTQMPSILGSRQAELTNLDFFENNAVPALAILVSGGYLTTEAFDYLKSNFEQVKGRGSTNKVIVLEARGAVEDSGNNGAVPTPTITMKPLYAERQNDALFQEFEQNCQDKIRNVFRLPAVFTGQAKDYTFASAKVSLEVAENQIFVPERVKFDDIINNKILQSWAPEYFRFRSNTAALVTSDDVLAAIKAFSDTGAMTPNIAIGVLNEKMNLDIPSVQEFWGNMPFNLIEAVIASHGDPDKTNFMIDAITALSFTDIAQLTSFVPREPVEIAVAEAQAKAQAAVVAAKPVATPATKKPKATKVKAEQPVENE